ncbi:FN3 associated domain-containing protein [Sunxiuqinia indica]|uniref:FN3 associated domain-containing protein n=1 Tax=Sunxiuqinia indica TaxID=2692584 RepID=UPI00135857EE|nr:FN3 associated domain-containing protein [Sunxiuqinia indica]
MLKILVILFLLCSTLVNAQTATDAVDYSFKRGFYTNSFQLELSSETPEATIRYTLDGSKPSATNGQIYSGPITIIETTMVRTYAYASNYEDSKIKTHTFIFPEQVKHQKNTMLEDYGFDYSPEETGKVFWTEEMDPEIVNSPEYGNQIIEGLKDIPTLSIVMKKEDLWGENGIHWGSKLTSRGDYFERECSIEMIYPEGYKGDKYKNWQEDCGIKIQGGGGRWDQGTYDHKQSFTLNFKKTYGAGKLKNEIFADAPHGSETACGKYDKIVLRSGHNKGWGSTWDREKTVYTRDQLGRDLQILMSGFGSHGTFVHLYLNGKYWGLYNPCERPDDNFLANNLGGENENYFSAKGKEPNASDDRSGEPGQSKSRFFEATSKDYSQMSYAEMKNWVMIDQSIACFLVYGYANPGDGPQYYYGNSNNPAGPVVWIPWDLEDSFDGGSRRTGAPSVSNMIKSLNTGDNGFQAFWTSVDFRMRFNDLVYQYFFNDGVLTDDRVIAYWDNLTNYIYKAIVCESARWGDERSSDPMDRDHEWDAARLAVRNDLRGRGEDFVSKLQESGYYSYLQPPKYFVEGVEVRSDSLNVGKNTRLGIQLDGAEGVVYYTIDGSDPRTWDLTASASASAISNQSMTIDKNTTVKARTKNGSEWSPLHEIHIVPTSNNISVEISLGNTTDNIALNDAGKLRVYPNPVTDRLFLSSESEFQVFSSTGVLLLEGKGDEIQMSNFQDGLYLIKVNTEVYKILKMN